MTRNVDVFIDRLLTEAEAADLIGFSKNTLRAWRVTGRPGGHPPPPFKKCGRAVRTWMDAQPSHLSTSEMGLAT